MAEGVMRGCNGADHWAEDHSLECAAGACASLREKHARHILDQTLSNLAGMYDRFNPSQAIRAQQS